MWPESGGAGRCGPSLVVQEDVARVWWWKMWPESGGGRCGPSLVVEDGTESSGGGRCGPSLVVQKDV
jgi:hypothetical protein